MTTRYIPITPLNMHSEIRIDTHGDETLVTVYNCDIKHLDLLIQQLEALKAQEAAVVAKVKQYEAEEPPQMTAVLGAKPNPAEWYGKTLAKVAAQPKPVAYVPPHTVYEKDPPMPQPKRGIHTINVIGVESKKRKNYGGTKNPDMNADIIKGESIRIYGLSEKRHKFDKETSTNIYYKVAYDRTFKIGDRVEYGSYNFAYIGRIVAIGEKTVKIDDGFESAHRSKNAQLSIEEFIRRNWDLDLVKLAEERANWYD